MSIIVTRAGKGAALTHAEMDANFTNLNTDKIEIAAGTKMAFYQAAAPVGWTIDPTITTVGMMVVDQAGGGVTGGTDDPLLNDKIPAHTHTMSPGGAHAHFNIFTATNIRTGGSSYGQTGGYMSSTPVTDGDHTHIIDNNAGAANWTPIYHKLIICSKD